VRCLIESVVVTVPDNEDVLKAKVHWIGREATALEVAKG
jgi:hypothetical protein